MDVALTQNLKVESGLGILHTLVVVFGKILTPNQFSRLPSPHQPVTLLPTCTNSALEPAKSPVIRNPPAMCCERNRERSVTVGAATSWETSSIRPWERRQSWQWPSAGCSDGSGPAEPSVEATVRSEKSWGITGDTRSNLHLLFTDDDSGNQEPGTCEVSPLRADTGTSLAKPVALSSDVPQNWVDFLGPNRLYELPHSDDDESDEDVHSQSMNGYYSNPVCRRLRTMSVSW